MASTDISLFAYEAAEVKKEKSANALRTISEAAEILDVPQHVLRFWETKFSQVKPLKRNGGRRFYRPQDIDILQQIKHLLYNQGYTIKGAQKAVNDFIAASRSSAVSSDDWIASLPPASVNDNIAGVAATLVHDEDELEQSDLLAELASALSEPAEVAEAVPSRDELVALRNELVALRDSLRVHLPAMTPVYQ